MIRVALVGAGFIGTTHALAYENIEGAEVVAVVDVNRELADSVAARYGARAEYELAGTLTDDSIDMVDVCLPTFLHEEAVVSAAKAGKHVLCEKPVALTLDAVDNMIDAVESTGVKAMIAQPLRFWPEFVVIKDLVDSGQLGRPIYANATRQVEPPGWSEWFRYPERSGGALLDLHIHDLDYLFHLLGMPERVSAVGSQSEYDAWDHVVTTLHYKDFAATAEASYLMPAGFPLTASFRLLGTEACVEYRLRIGGQVDKRDSAQRDFTLWRSGKPPETPDSSGKDAFEAEIEYFRDCLETHTDPAIATLNEARAVLRIALAARESLERETIVML